MIQYKVLYDNFDSFILIYVTGFLWWFGARYSQDLVVKLCKRCLKVEQSHLEEMWLLYTLTRLHKSHLCSDQLAIRQLALEQLELYYKVSSLTLEDLEMLLCRIVNPFNHAFTERYDLQIIHVKMGRADHWIVVATHNRLCRGRN